MKRGGILSLGFDLDKISVRHHQPERAVFAFILKCLEAVMAIEVDGFGVTFSGGGGELPCRGRCLDIIGVGRGIQDANRRRRNVIT